MDERKFLFAYDRKRTSTLTLDEQPGAHTGATRKYIPGYADSNIVFLNTSTGNDANTGASIAQAVLTYAQAATLAGSTKKIRLVNSDTLSVNITKPTEATIGTTSTITGIVTANIDNFTAGVGGQSTQLAAAYCHGLGKFVTVGTTDKICWSSNGTSWTDAVTPASGGNAYTDIIWVSSLNKAIALGANFISYSTDLITWTQYDVSFSAAVNMCYSEELSRLVIVGGLNTIVTDDFDVWQVGAIGIGASDSVSCIAYSDTLNLFVCGTSAGQIFTSPDGLVWTAAATPGFGGTQIEAVTWAANIAKFVAVGSSGKIYYSADGDVWTAAGTPSFGATNVLGVNYISELGYIVACGGSGKVAYSTDGNVFTQATVAGIRGNFGIAYSTILGKVLTVGSTSETQLSDGPDVTISASHAGFTVANVLFSGTATGYNCTYGRIGTTAALSLDACRVTESGSHISNNAITSRATLYEGDRHTTCTPAAQNAIDMNLDTVGGTWYIYNASQTGYERIRDCLVVNGIVANYPVTVSGRANVQGTSTNALFDAEVTHEDPRFVDETDYKLEFQTNGYSRNSFAAGRSNLYFNSAGDARDIGAWSYIESAVSYYFSKSAYLYKGDITHGLEFALNEQQGDSGVVTVYGNTRRIKEVIVISYGSTRPNEREVFDYMLTLTDKTVKIQLDPEWDSNPGTVIANGNQSAGVEFLTVDATATYEGMTLTISDKLYFVMRASPSTTAATKLILDRPLEDAVSDNEAITRNYPTGAGEYQFAGPVNTQLKRNTPEYFQGWQRGFALKFVRKKQ